MRNFVVVFLLLISVAPVFPQTESITITTYYPSPYGVYSNLQADKFALGDTDGDGSITAADLPSTSGNMVFKPHTSAPSTWAPGKEGELAYSQGDHMFYYYNGGGWAPQAGGGGAIVLIGQSTGPGVPPPPCPNGWTAAMTGFWNCPYVNSTTGVDYFAGNCFCGLGGDYRFGNVYYTTRGTAADTTKCTVCVK